MRHALAERLEIGPAKRAGAIAGQTLRFDDRDLRERVGVTMQVSQIERALIERPAIAPFVFARDDERVRHESGERSLLERGVSGILIGHEHRFHRGGLEYQQSARERKPRPKMVASRS